MKRKLTFILLYFIFNILHSSQAVGQTLYNLDIIWQKASPDHVTSGAVPYWGYNMVGGDLNGDGYSDFVSATDSVLDAFGWLQWKIYIFNGGVALSTSPSQVIMYDTAGGHPTMCIADFNGDGYGDLALGDSYGTGANQAKGQVNIHYGTGVDLNPTPDLVIGGYGSATATAYGWDVSGGDINGDGIDDLVVGAPYWGPMYSLGRVYVYYGDTLGLHTWPDIILNGHTEAGYYEDFGNSVDATVDYNKDGYNDLLVGAYLNAKNGNSAGKVYYYISDNASIDTIADGWFYGEASYQMLGAYNVSSICSDSLIFEPVGWYGTPDWPNTSTWGDGKCYMVPGDTTGELIPEWTITGNEYLDSALGYWSSSAGYADSDKLGDFSASALKAFSDPGKVYLWLRRPAMKNQYDAYIIGRGSTPGGDALGARIAPAGDVDGCGRDEFMVSNYFADTDNMIWLCKYTGPDANAVAGEPVNNEQLAINNVLQNSPNPFSHQTTIKYQVPQTGKISLKIYNISGQLVKTLVNEETSPSTPSPQGEGRVGSVVWDGRDDNGQRVSNGVYVYRLQSDSQCLSRKMILLK
jgi:hypothetical protein